MNLTHGSLFTGIGGFDLGFERAGFRTAWQVEIDPFRRAILATHFPKAAQFADIRDCGAHNLEKVNCVTAGVPCQDVSVAGRRAGLHGKRTGLFFEFARILRELRPAWFVFENVPGLFSSNGGRDFAEVLRVLMVECGYGVSWRVLNSQFFGVAQRRRRVFIVGRFGKPCPAEILFDPESRCGNFAAGRKAGQDVAYALAASVRGTGDGHGQGWNSNYARGLRAADGHHGHSGPRGDGSDNLVATLNSSGNEGGFRTEPGEHIVIAPLKASDAQNFAGSGQRNDGVGTAILCAPPDADGVRDFAGLPEGLDSARYRALGDAVTVQVAEWIVRRLIAA